MVNNDFLPWLGYVWPDEKYSFYHSESNAFPKIQPGQFKVDDGLSEATTIKFYFPDGDPAAPPIKSGLKYQQQFILEGRRMNAFVPGIASMVNSDESWDNIYFTPNTEDHDDGHFQYYDDHDTGHRSRYHHNGFMTNQYVPAGSELFLYYGEDYHHALTAKQVTNKDYETLDDYKEKLDFSTVATEEQKRSLLNTTSMRLRTDDDADFRNREEELGATIKKRERKIIAITDEEERPGRNIDWITTHGVCVDNLSVDHSTIPDAGYGAYAKTSIAAGQVVSYAPVLNLKRDDLVFYGTKKNEFKKGPSARPFVLDFDKVSGHELIMNYCFGHPDSELMFVPYSPVVNYINHDGKNPNTKIQWTEESKALLELHPIDVLEQHGGSLRLEYVALRDIGPEEEITIDYGTAWAEAWEAYQKDGEKGNFRHEIGVPDGLYPANWLNTSVTYELAPKGELQDW